MGKIVIIFLTFIPFSLKAQENTLKYLTYTESLNIDELKVISKKNNSKYLVVINSSIYIPATECLPNRSLGGGKDDRDLSGGSDDRSLGGGKDDRDLSGGSDDRSLGSGKDDRDLSGGSDNRFLGGGKDDRDLSGGSDYRSLGGGKDDRNLAGERIIITCKKLENTVGFLILNVTPKARIYFFDGIKLNEIKNNTVLIEEE